MLIRHCQRVLSEDSMSMSQTRAATVEAQSQRVRLQIWRPEDLSVPRLNPRMATTRNPKTKPRKWFSLFGEYLYIFLSDYFD